MTLKYRKHGKINNYSKRNVTIMSYYKNSLKLIKFNKYFNQLKKIHLIV